MCCQLLMQSSLAEEEHTHAAYVCASLVTLLLPAAKRNLHQPSAWSRNCGSQNIHSWGPSPASAASWLLCNSSTAWAWSGLPPALLQKPCCSHCSCCCSRARDTVSTTPGGACCPLKQQRSSASTPAARAATSLGSTGSSVAAAAAAEPLPWLWCSSSRAACASWLACGAVATP